MTGGGTWVKARGLRNGNHSHSGWSGRDSANVRLQFCNIELVNCCKLRRKGKQLIRRAFLNMSLLSVTHKVDGSRGKNQMFP